MKTLKELPDELKIKYFDYILEAYEKDTTFHEFGFAVDAVLADVKSYLD